MKLENNLIKERITTRNLQKEVQVEKYDLDSLILVWTDELVVLANGEKIKSNTKVTRRDKILVLLSEELPIRNMDFKLSKDELEATINIKLVDGMSSSVDEKLIGNMLKLSLNKSNILKAPKFTKEEIYLKTKLTGITNGIIEKTVNEIISSNEKDISKVIARGKEPIDDEEDKIEILFSRKQQRDTSTEKIDYRNLKKIEMIKKGEVIGRIIRGKTGEDGKNVLNNPIQRRTKKVLEVKCKVGCYIKNDEVIAMLDGKPEFSKNTFSVNKVLEVNRNVDMDSGNISFIGDVHINGDIGIGMTVESGEGIFIKGNIEQGCIVSKKQSELEGKVILSKVLVGVKNESFMKYAQSLEELKLKLIDLNEYARQIYDKKSTDEHLFGKILKIVIESKIKDLSKVAISVISYKEDNEVLANLIRKKIIGLGPLSIKGSRELSEIINSVETQLIKCKEILEEKHNLIIEYAQDSKIICSGDVCFTGKGQYISEITAGGNVEFMGKDSIARGGIIKATKAIKAKVIGSPGGATTTLEVEKDGEIVAETVYRNTVFKVGNKSKVIEEDSKNVKVTLKNNEIEIERLIL